VNHDTRKPDEPFEVQLEKTIKVVLDGLSTAADFTNSAGFLTSIAVISVRVPCTCAMERRHGSQPESRNGDLGFHHPIEGIPRSGEDTCVGIRPLRLQGFGSDEDVTANIALLLFAAVDLSADNQSAFRF